MKILIQNTETQHYLTSYGHWTVDPIAAEDFLGPGRAWHFANLTLAGDFRVLVYFPDTHAAVTIKEQRGATHESGMLLAA